LNRADAVGLAVAIAAIDLSTEEARLVYDAGLSLLTLGVFGADPRGALVACALDLDGACLFAIASVRGKGTLLTGKRLTLPSGSTGTALGLSLTGLRLGRVGGDAQLVDAGVAPNVAGTHGFSVAIGVVITVGPRADLSFRAVAVEDAGEPSGATTAARATAAAPAAAAAYAGHAALTLEAIAVYGTSAQRQAPKKSYEKRNPKHRKSPCSSI
jgi:hypothetical protein